MARMIAATLSAALLGAAGAATAAPPASLPQPESGLWEMKTSVAEIGGMTMNFESCVDGSVEDMLAHPDVRNADCSEPRIEHRGNHLVVSTTCKIEGSTARIDGVFSGDFKRSYRGEIRSTYTPPLQGMTATTMNVDARWISACRPGQNPGDTQMTGVPSIPGIGNIDLEGLMRNLPQLPGR